MTCEKAHDSRKIPATIDINRSGLPARMFFALKLALSVESIDINTSGLPARLQRASSKMAEV